MAKQITPRVDNLQLEADLIAGDREAVAAALLRLAEKLVQQAAWKLPPSLELDDLVQEAAVDALARLAGWERPRGKAVTYATGAIRFVILDRSRKARRHQRRFVQAGNDCRSA